MIAALVGNDSRHVPPGIVEELTRWAAHAAVWQAVRHLFYSLTPAGSLVALVVLVGAYTLARRRRGVRSFSRVASRLGRRR